MREVTIVVTEQTIVVTEQTIDPMVVIGLKTLTLYEGGNSNFNPNPKTV